MGAPVLPHQSDPEAVERVSRAFADLVSGEGWKLFIRYCLGQQAQVMRTLEEAKDPYLITRCAGQLAILRELMTWPERQAQEFQKHAQRSGYTQFMDEVNKIVGG